MNSAILSPHKAGTICVNCGVPIDSKYFDESGFAPVPAAGRKVTLARFDLPPQYCGVLEYFAQFTDAAARNPAAVETPTVDWLLLLNGRPLYPYVQIQHILNPWGFGSFQISVRLDEAAIVEFAVRGAVSPAPGVPADPVSRVGGRIVGRYWYNPVYGDPVRQRF